MRKVRRKAEALINKIIDTYGIKLVSEMLRKARIEIEERKEAGNE